MFRAPRGLKEPVFWKHSHLRKSSRHALPELREERVGVR